jgi:DsbC/DsbD-like thiol-disulfide interchange protein
MGARDTPLRTPCLIVLLALAAVAEAAPRRLPENPAEIRIAVSPEAVAPGETAAVSVEILPQEGIKIARYPQIKLEVSGTGLVEDAEARIGNATPPPPDQLATNYWGKVDPVRLTLTVHGTAAAGAHEIDGKLTYFFCVSGDFCAPARVPVKIPLAVR